MGWNRGLRWDGHCRRGWMERSAVTRPGASPTLHPRMASPESAPGRPVFTTGVALAAVLAGCKAFDLLPAQKGALTFGSDLLVAVHEDLAFALASAVIAAVVLRAARSRPRIERAAWIAWI